MPDFSGIENFKNHIELFESALKGKAGFPQFPEQLLNLIVRETRLESAVLFRRENEHSMRVVARSDGASTNYSRDSVFSCVSCPAIKDDDKFTVSNETSCNLIVGSPAGYENCIGFADSHGTKYILRFSGRKPDSLEDKLSLESVANIMLGLLEKWEFPNSSQISNSIESIALELRSPINSILGFISILSEDPLSSSQSEYMRTIKTNAQKLLINVNDLLDVARIEKQKTELKKTSFDLRKLISEILVLLGEKVQTEFSVEAAQDVPESIVSDEHKFRYVLSNLMYLASLISSLNRVSLKISVSEEEINFSIFSAGKKADIYNLERLFEPFEASKTPSVNSTRLAGLGLTLTKKYAEFIGGRILLTDSTEEVKLRLSIPLDKVQDTKANPTIAVKTTIEEIKAKSTSNKILLIIDDFASCRLMQSYLKKWGYDPVLVNEGTQALKISEQERLLAVIMDLQLPGLNSLDLLKQLNDRLKGKNTPVIVCSVAADEQKAYLMGAMDYFTKPVNYNYLVEALRNYNLRRNSRILCVDDDEPTLGLLKQAIESAGFIAVTESRSSNVMNLIKDEDLDLAIIDLDMPSPDGFELIEMIKNDLKFKNLPVIIYTGKENFSDDLRRIDGLFEELLSKKSVKIEDLAETISHMVQKNETPPKAEEVLKTKGGIKILLAEDYKHSQIIVTRLLKKNGFSEIVVAENGQDAKDYALSENFDLILMDMQMPIMNGFEAIEEIRKHDSYKETPIIALTAFAMKGDREKCIEAGATDYIPKPIDSKEFIEKVRRYTSA